MAFEPGDIVQLKSGSPVLTVVEAETRGVTVVWYAEETGKFRSDVLPAVALEPVDLAEYEVEDEDGEAEEDEEDQD